MKAILTSLLLLLLVLIACKAPDKKEEGELLNVIYDTDMGNDTDDILGLIMLHNYVDLGTVNLLGVGTSKDHPYSARYIDLLNTWYKHGDVPIGVVVDGPEVDSIMAIPRYLTTVVDMERDMTAVLYAVETAEGYFNLSEPGRASLGWEPEIRHHIVTKFTPDPNGNHFYLVVDSMQRERIQTRFLEIVPMDPNRIE